MNVETTSPAPVQSPARNLTASIPPKPTANEQARLDAIWHAVREGKDPVALHLIG